MQKKADVTEDTLQNGLQRIEFSIQILLIRPNHIFTLFILFYFLGGGGFSSGLGYPKTSYKFCRYPGPDRTPYAPPKKKVLAFLFIFGRVVHKIYAVFFWR